MSALQWRPEPWSLAETYLVLESRRRSKKGRGKKTFDDHLESVSTPVVVWWCGGGGGGDNSDGRLVVVVVVLCDSRFVDLPGTAKRCLS